MCSHRVALRFHIHLFENAFVFGVTNSVGSLGCFFFPAVKLVYTSDKVSGKYDGLKRTTLCLVVFSNFTAAGVVGVTWELDAGQCRCFEL